MKSLVPKGEAADEATEGVEDLEVVGGEAVALSEAEVEVQWEEGEAEGEEGPLTEYELFYVCPIFYLPLWLKMRFGAKFHGGCLVSLPHSQAA